ncbi:MAG: competence ComEA helix-hairpin-helix repeat region domain protein [Parcubacteria group bacterium]|nr:competence ComEA helix-hairpin-helix repeat region domain protein [Parcubacteria group bacterium]
MTIRRLLPSVLFAVAMVSVLGTQASASSVININTASVTQLDTLPGIGPSKAAAIVSYRDQHGSFANKSDIQNVSGIGPATYAKLEGLITADAAVTAPAIGAPKPVQPVGRPVSYTKVQQVDSKSNNPVLTNTHDDAAVAPAEATQVAAAGAVFTGVQPQTDNVHPAVKRTRNPFSSIWTFGLLGVIAIAGGAFILL